MHWLLDAGHDVRFGARWLRRSPGFAALAALALALGIGANTAVFSMVDGVLLRPLSYREPGRLVAIWDRGVRDENLSKVFASYADFDDYRSARSFDAIAAATWATGARILTNPGPPTQMLAIPVSAGFFSMLGVPAALGRTFQPDDETRGCSVVVADGFWRSRLAADAGAIGRGLTLDQRLCTIVGIMPPGFSFYPHQAQIWMLIDKGFQPSTEKLSVGIFARLRPGVTRAQALAELTALHWAQHGQTPEDRDFVPVVDDLREEFTFLASRTLRTTLWLLSAAVGFVLLIACLNVANLLLGRSTVRRRELALRAALGSGRGRLVRQLLAEGLLLAMLGGLLGVGLAFGAIRYILAANPVELPVDADVRIHVPVILFTVAISILSVLAFTLLPALGAARIDVHEALKSGGRGAPRGTRPRVAWLLVLVQVSLSMVLLTAAGLLMQSVLKMGSASMGFRPDHLLVTGITVPGRGQPDPKILLPLYENVRRRLTTISGVAGVALSSGNLPPYGGPVDRLAVEGETASQTLDVGQRGIDPGFLAVLGVPLMRGRNFDDRDRIGGEPVALINEALAREYFPGRNALGQRIRLGTEPRLGPWLTIIGVIGDIKTGTLLREMSWEASPIVYSPLAQEPRLSVGVEIRTAGNVAGLGAAISREIAASDAHIVVGGRSTMESRLGEVLAYPRFRALILSVFAGCALLLAVIGLNGVLGQFVAQRTPEFGIRMALGAKPGDILRLVARQGGVPVVMGLAAGIAGAAASSRVLSGLLYGVTPLDPWTMAGVAAMLLAAAAAGIVFPARRAARLDPMAALREE
jgi:putative ABC transport system permease protein